MQTKSKLAFVAWGILGVAAVAGIYAFAFTFLPRNAPGDQLTFPIEWTGALNTGEVWLEDSSIRLQSDGTAALTDVVGGSLREVGRVICVDASPTLYSGPADWDISEHGALILRYSGGQAVLFPRPARFEGVDWSSIREPICEREYVDYGARTPER